jgi:hypothetical protein
VFLLLCWFDVTQHARLSACQDATVTSGKADQHLISLCMPCPADATALPKTAAKDRMATNLQEQEQAAAAGNGGRQQGAAGMQGQAPVGGGAGGTI